MGLEGTPGPGQRQETLEEEVARLEAMLARLRQELAAAEGLYHQRRDELMETKRTVAVTQPAPTPAE